MVTGRPLVFLGTPSAAAVVLDRLLRDGRDIVHVVTGEDKRRGRGSGTSPSPVKALALARGVPVSHDLGWFKDDIPVGLLGIVVAYGRLIPAWTLERVPMWNVHFSMLPRWRGAAPVERAILAGDEQTGVCIMQMDEGLDTGPVLNSTVLPLDGSETTVTLTERLAGIGADILLDTLDDPAPVASPQHGEPTYAKKVDKEEARIDWHQPAIIVSRTVRALRAHTSVDGVRVRVLGVGGCPTGSVHAGAPGQVFDDGCVQTGEGTLRLEVVQPEGRAPQGVLEWLNGLRGRAIRCT